MVWRPKTLRPPAVGPLYPYSVVSIMTVACGQAVFAFSSHLMYTLCASILTTSVGSFCGQPRVQRPRPNTRWMELWSKLVVNKR